MHLKVFFRKCEKENKREIKHGLCACTERKSSIFSSETVDRTGAQPMLYLTCTTISSVDLAYYGESRFADWGICDCGIIYNTSLNDLEIIMSLKKIQRFC